MVEGRIIVGGILVTTKRLYDITKRRLSRHREGFAVVSTFGNVLVDFTELYSRIIQLRPVNSGWIYRTLKQISNNRLWIELDRFVDDTELFE